MKSLLVIVLVLLCGRIECQSNISEVLTELDCTEFLNLLNTSGVLETLYTLPEVTLFAPTDDAINAAGALPDDNVELVALVKYHAIQSSIQSTNFTNEGTEVSANGASIRLNKYNEDPVIYTAQGAQLTTTDVDVQTDSGDGYVHVIKAVMTPPSGTIYELISNNVTFSRLKEAIDLVGLNGTLNDTDPFTIFAPTNDAFDNVPAADLTALFENVTALKDVLDYHVIGATHFSADLDGDDVFETVQGESIQIVKNDDGTIFINEAGYAKLTSTDLSVTNGVVHVIDRVLKMDVDNGSTALSSQTSFIVTCLTICISVLKS